MKAAKLGGVALAILMMALVSRSRADMVYSLQAYDVEDASWKRPQQRGRYSLYHQPGRLDGLV